MINYMNHKKKGIVYATSSICFLFCMSIYSIIISNNLNYNYIFIAILPLFYTICITTLLLIDTKFMYNFAKVLIIFFYGIRIFVFPILICIYGEYSSSIVSDNIIYNIDKSVMIQCYEFLVITIFLGMNRKYKKTHKQFEIKIINDLRASKNIRYAITILFAVFGMILFIYPSLVGKFRPIMFTDKEVQLAWKINNEQIKYNVPTIIYHISVWANSILRILIVYTLLIFIKKKERNGKNENKYIFISLVIISTLILIVTDDKAGSIFAAIAMLSLLTKIYPNKRKTITIIIVVSIFIIGFGIFIVLPLMNSTENFQNFIEYRLNAYFSGFINIAAALNMPRENLLTYFIGDVLRSIPLIKGFFTNMPMSYILFNQSLAYDTIYNSQIIPCVGQSYFYFGYIGAPIFSLILVSISLKCYEKVKTIEDTLGYFIYYYIMLFASLGIVLYDFFLTFSLMLQYCFPIWVLYKVFLIKIKEEKIHSDII